MIQRLGDCALRFPRPKGKSEASLLAAVRGWPGIIDACMTEEWVAVYFADGVSAHLGEAQIESLGKLPESANAPHDVEIAVRYDGADLADVARACSLPAERVRALHAGAVYTVLFLGFMPGFAYLGGLPRELELPRLASPRVHVPKNAVAIAHRYSGIYPFASPGGWRLVGTAVDVSAAGAPPQARGDVSLFGDQGALLRAGDRVRFRDVTKT